MNNERKHGVISAAPSLKIETFYLWTESLYFLEKAEHQSHEGLIPILDNHQGLGSCPMWMWHVPSSSLQSPHLALFPQLPGLHRVGDQETSTPPFVRLFQSRYTG